MVKNMVHCDYCTNTLKKITVPINMDCKSSRYNHKRYNPDCK